MRTIKVLLWIVSCIFRADATEHDVLNLREPYSYSQENFARKRADLHAFATFSGEIASINRQACSSTLSEEQLSALDALNKRWKEALSDAAARCAALHKRMLAAVKMEEMCEEWLLFTTQAQVTLSTPSTCDQLNEQAR